MSNWPWEKDYEVLLRQGKKEGEVPGEKKESERRRHPRFKMKTEHVWIRLESRFDVVDVSVSGISVYSEVPFKVGVTISISLGKAFSVDADVVDCDMVQTDLDLLEAKYLVRCIFSDEITGMQFLVMIKEMDNLKVNERPSV